jgi:hypothetical protein
MTAESLTSHAMMVTLLDTDNNALPSLSIIPLPLWTCKEGNIRPGENHSSYPISGISPFKPAVTTSPASAMHTPRPQYMTISVVGSCGESSYVVSCETDVGTVSCVGRTLCLVSWIRITELRLQSDSRIAYFTCYDVNTA